MDDKPDVSAIFAQFRQLNTDAQRRLLTAILEVQSYLTDSQVCALLQIDVATLRRWLQDGPPPTKPDAVDIRLADPINIGGQRRWNRAKLEAIFS